MIWSERLLFFLHGIFWFEFGKLSFDMSQNFPSLVILYWFSSSSYKEPCEIPISICLCYRKLVEESDRLTTSNPSLSFFLSLVLICSIDCNFKPVWICHSHLWFGKLVFLSWGEAVALSPFSLCWCSIGFARINSATAFGLLPRWESVQEWCPGCMGLTEEKQSSEGKNPLFMGYRVKNYTIQLFFFFFREVNYILRTRPSWDLNQQILVIP